MSTIIAADNEKDPRINVDLQIAKDPETDSGKLEKLSRHLNEDIRIAVASNPNTPSNVLQHLIKYYPHEVVTNPAFYLIMLSNPNWIEEIPWADLSAIIARPNAPAVLLKAAAEHRLAIVSIHAIRVIARNPKTPVSELERIINYRNYFRAQILESPNLTLDFLRTLATHHSSSIQASFAISFLSSRDLFLQHFTPADISSIWEMILKDIIENRKYDVRRVLLGHKMLPIESAKVLNSIR
jgi:hypothetical protein